MNRPFDLILINRFEADVRKNRVHLTCRTMGDMSDPKRLAFVGSNQELTSKIGKLLEDYCKQLEKPSRGAS
jgi:hypothetical protein